jgi:hypothetical protein
MLNYEIKLTKDDKKAIQEIADKKRTDYLNDCQEKGVDPSQERLDALPEIARKQYAIDKIQDLGKAAMRAANNATAMTSDEALQNLAEIELYQTVMKKYVDKARTNLIDRIDLNDCYGRAEILGNIIDAAAVEEYIIDSQHDRKTLQGQLPPAFIKICEVIALDKNAIKKMHLAGDQTLLDEINKGSLTVSVERRPVVKVKKVA